MFDTIKKITFAAVIAYIPVEVCAQDINWLDAHEAGTFLHVETFFAPLFARLSRVEDAWSVTQSHRRSGAGHDHIDRVNRELCYLAIQVIDLQRASDRSASTYFPRRKLVSPTATQAYVDAARATLMVARQYPNVKHCNELTWDDRVKFSRALFAAKKQREALAALTLGRSKGRYSWSNTLSIELSPLPLKLELLEGSLKFKFTGKLGRFKIDGQTGPKRVQTSHFNGLQFFRLVGPDGSMRVFDVRGKNFSFPTGIGQIDVAGASLVYTCNSQCAAAYDEMIN